MPEAADKQQVKILWGLPASGKTTEAKKWVDADPAKRTRINYDDLRLELFGPNWVWNRKEENLVQAKAFETFENALRLGMSVVIDNTSLTEKVRQPWIDRAKAHKIDVKVEQVGADLSIPTLIRRDEARGKARVGRAVIERMALFNNLIDWQARTYDGEGFIICDLDGTLADITHRKHFIEGTTPKNWKSFFENVADDALNGPVADLLDIFADHGYQILIVTGRPITPCGIPTEDWLAKYEIPYTQLFMRQGGDSRPDTVVKKEILDHLDKDRIVYVLEDRASVTQMWRDNGLFVLQCDKGDF